MLNTKQAYIEAGTKAAQAVNNGDMSTQRHWKDHFNAMLSLEEKQAKSLATSLFQSAYKANRRM